MWYAVAQWLRHCATNRKVAGSIFRGPLLTKTETKQSYLVAQGDCSITAIIPIAFVMFSDISKCLFISRFSEGTPRMFRETLVWKYRSQILLWLRCSNCLYAGRKSNHSYSCWRWNSSLSQSNHTNCGVHPASYSTDSGYLGFFSLRESDCSSACSV
jgi:hypothetical protein